MKSREELASRGILHVLKRGRELRPVETEPQHYVAGLDLIIHFEIPREKRLELAVLSRNGSAGGSIRLGRGVPLGWPSGRHETRTRMHSSSSSSASMRTRAGSSRISSRIRSSAWLESAG